MSGDKHLVFFGWVRLFVAIFWSWRLSDGCTEMSRDGFLQNIFVGMMIYLIQRI